MAALREIDSTNTLGTVTDGDDLYFTRGGTDVDTNLDQSGLATGLNSITVARAWTANIGNTSTSLKADLDFVVQRRRRSDVVHSRRKFDVS
jgi:hypothetical protein